LIEKKAGRSKDDEKRRFRSGRPKIAELEAGGRETNPTAWYFQEEWRRERDCEKVWYNRVKDPGSLEKGL